MSPMVPAFVFCTQAGRNVTMVLSCYYSNLGLGVYPWESEHHSERISDKDFVLKYLIMFSNRRFHLRYSVLESPTVLMTLKECFSVWEGQPPGKVIFLRRRRWTTALFPLIHTEIDAGRGVVAPGCLLLKFTLSKKYLWKHLLCARYFFHAREIAVN